MHCPPPLLLACASLCEPLLAPAVIPTNVAITGRGNHVLADGRRGVLREEIAAYLTEDLGLAAALAKGNDGRLIVRAQDLRRWMSSCPPPDT